MYLTKEQERMLDGEHGEIVARMMHLLVRLGEIYKADKMITIASAQIAGVSYKSIGDPGLEFLKDIANKGARVKVLTYLNPAGIDIEAWQDIGFPGDFAKKQMEIIDAFRQMGVNITATCTPYLAGNLPRFHEHIAWSESSAVSFANSVLGARTNREGGPSALAAAITGFTPNYGLHIGENRRPEVVVKVSAELKSISDFGALGYLVGKEVKNKIPYFIGIKHAGVDELKALGAAMAASGAVALYHVAGITPEASIFENELKLEGIEIGNEEIKKAYDELSNTADIDIVVIGCPHASIKEIAYVASKLKGKKLKKELWVTTSRAIKEIANRAGYTEIIEKAGGKVVADTCMVVSPIELMGYKRMGVNSGKAAKYLPGFCKQQVLFASIDKLLEKVVK
ncbi:MAG TPA: DUF521 domain-containing protein [Candidatus Aenigmarchaeota archaeon]|nr:DUF521 domain-containing protein [Candidatus Aenigmarchaeota archaeon]